MMTHGDFTSLQSMHGFFSSASASAWRDFDELKASGNGNEAALAARWERACSLFDEAFKWSCKVHSAPVYGHWKTIALAEGVELTHELVCRMVAIAAVKRRTTVRDLDKLPAVEVAAMVAADAATAAQSSKADDSVREASEQAELPGSNEIPTPNHDYLTRQQSILFGYLNERRKKTIRFEDLPPDAFQEKNRVTDNAIIKSLKRLRSALQARDPRVDLTIHEADRTLVFALISVP